MVAGVAGRQFYKPLVCLNCNQCWQEWKIGRHVFGGRGVVGALIAVRFSQRFFTSCRSRYYCTLRGSSDYRPLVEQLSPALSNVFYQSSGNISHPVSALRTLRLRLRVLRSSRATQLNGPTQPKSNTPPFVSNLYTTIMSNKYETKEKCV